MREKVKNKYHVDVKIYSKEHWSLFRKLREKSFNYMQLLSRFDPIIYGSIARGDVHPKSDIDIMFLKPINEFHITNILGDPFQKWIVQATPLSAIKGVLVYYDINISFPLIPLYPREEEFYYFGGSLSFDKINSDKFIRTPGINKQLLYIYPTENGHKELRITTDNASIIAKNLKIKIDTILERIRVLERRDKIGRTGIFLKRLLRPDDSFGTILNQIKSTNPATRRRIKRQKI
ncbi:MAG: nucleotidyltransferase domain-containing protein [Candidatus Helarchaeota archaeon]